MTNGIRLTPRIGLVALLAMLGTLVFGTTAANAGQGDATALCAFTGLTGKLVPTIPPVGAGQDQDGVFTFKGGTGIAGATSCVLADDGENGGAGDSPTPGTYNVTIYADGYYSNFSCGTGSVQGTAGAWSTDPAFAKDIGNTAAALPPAPPSQTNLVNYLPGSSSNPNGYTGIGFGINFTGGAGPLGGGAVGPYNSTITPADIDPPDASAVAGSVSILPTDPPSATCLAPPNVAGFTVTGAFALS